ncbi:retrovirus-related pol polyprotein from transposon TNT 1-94 [Tanacetum coccineum]
MANTGRVWKSVRYGVSKGLDTAYWGVSWSRHHARIRRIFLDGYGVLVLRIVIFKISSFKLQNARLLLIFTKYSWFRRGEALQAKKAESSNVNRSKTPTKRKLIWYLDSRCSRHMTGVKSYLQKYVEQPGPKVVFGDDFTCTTEGYGSIKCNGIFDKKKGIIFNSIKEVVMIAPRVRDVYVLDMTSSAQQSCFFAKASESLNWLWHKRLALLNFKTFNQMAKQNLVIGLPSLVYSKDKPCSSYENGKHHRASFKTKQTSSIKKCLYLLHMNLFGPITHRSINHEKYTLLIVDEYSRTDNGTEFGNNILVNFCDEKGISQNFSSPYTPEQNGVAERKNRTLIEAARTMLLGSVFSKQY